eukprot:6783736-Alexandrium_andersonii.AAC.1
MCLALRPSTRPYTPHPTPQSRVRNAKKAHGRSCTSAPSKALKMHSRMASVMGGSLRCACAQSRKRSCRSGS